MKKEFFFPSSEGNTNIHAVVWTPEGQPRAIVQMAHGMIEHIGRYEAFAKFLNAHGILAAGHDHLGHGKSVSCKENYGFFAEGRGETCAVSDMHRLTVILKKKYPDVPYIILGHSMGSFLTRRYLSVYPDEAEAAFILGTGWFSEPTIYLGLTLSGLIGKLKGSHGHCIVMDTLAFGNLNRRCKPVRTAKDWLSSDPAEVDAYLAEEHVDFTFSMNGYQTLFYAILGSESIEEMDKMRSDIPIFLLSGEEDPVGDYGKSVRKTEQKMKHAGLWNVECKLYPGMRHEILHEKGKETVYDDILERIESVLE